MFAKVGKEGWELSKDPTEDFTPAKKQNLEALVGWLSEHMRTIKLPDLLIEVDNDLHFTNDFLPAAKRNERNSNDICSILTTIMAQLQRCCHQTALHIIIRSFMFNTNLPYGLM